MFTVVVTWISSLYFTKIISVQIFFKTHFRTGNPPLCSCIMAVSSGPNSYTFTVILAVFAPELRWRHKPWKGLLTLKSLWLEETAGLMKSKTWNSRLNWSLFWYYIQFWNASKSPTAYMTMHEVPQAAQTHYMNADVTLACERCCVTNG